MRVPALRIATALLLGVIVGLCAADAYAQGLPPAQTKPADIAKIAKMVLPDLVITGAKVDGAKMTVTVKNACKANAPQSRLSLLAYAGPTKTSAKLLLFENDVPAIKAGASADVVFDASTNPKVVTFAGKFYQLEADPAHKIAEAVETNNWADGPPSHFPFPNSATACNPK